MIISGRDIAGQYYDALAQRCAALPYTPGFCDVLVGDDPVNAQYVRMKEKRARSIGLAVHQATHTAAISTEELQEAIRQYNTISDLRGLIVQLPLPDHIDAQIVLDTIDPRLDVDVLTTENTDLFYHDTPRFVYPTARAISIILDAIDRSWRNRHVVVVGAGRLVGRPFAQLLTHAGVAHTVVTKETPNPQATIKTGDVVVSAAGVPELIDAAMIKPGAIVIDAGTSEAYNTVVGDVVTDSVASVASYVSPVPGGVGPVTIAALFENIIASAEARGAGALE